MSDYELLEPSEHADGGEYLQRTLADHLENTGALLAEFTPESRKRWISGLTELSGAQPTLNEGIALIAQLLGKQSPEQQMLWIDELRAMVGDDD